MLNKGFTNKMVGIPMPCSMKALLEAEFNKLKKSDSYDNDVIVETIENDLKQATLRITPLLLPVVLFLIYKNFQK